MKYFKEVTYSVTFQYERLDSSNGTVIHCFESELW